MFEDTKKAQSLHLQRALLDNIPDMAWLKDRDSRYLAVNTAYLKILGVDESTVIGKTPHEIWPKDLADVYMQTDRAVLKSGRRRRYEESRQDPNGNVLWFETIKSPIRDDRGHIIGTVGISRDITERKAESDELIRSRTQLRELSSFLQSVREEERARISRELHDELGQTLTATKIELTWLRDRLDASDQLQGKVDRLVSIVDRSIMDLRRIAANLRPIMLDELGLVSAIKWLTQNSAELTGLDISLTFDREDMNYNGEVSTAAFRIVQEALTNVMRHGEATHASVDVHHANGDLLIEIKDNGKGFGPEATRQNRLGLVGMRERANVLGGSVEIGTNPEGGTIVAVHLPLIDRSPRATVAE
jgi:two-component system, NarL family, sensor histidine kinase UhpB